MCSAHVHYDNSVGGPEILQAFELELRTIRGISPSVIVLKKNIVTQMAIVLGRTRIARSHRIQAWT